MDYTKNISQDIFTPQQGSKDFKNTIPETVFKASKRLKSAAVSATRDSSARFKFLNASETAKKYAKLKVLQKDLNQET